MDLLNWKFHQEAASILLEIIDVLESCAPLKAASFLAWRLQVLVSNLTV